MKKQNKKLKMETIFIVVLLAIAFTVRVINIGSYDIGSCWDEGYDAIVTRNMIEDSKNLLYPSMFNENFKGLLYNKPPVFFWIGALSLKLFGVHEFSYRIVSVLAGTLAVFIFYLLTKLLFRKRMVIIAAVIFAFFPLHIVFSRVYQKDMFVLMLTLFTAYLLIRGVAEKRKIFLWLSALLIGINLLTKFWQGILPIIAVIVWLFIKHFKKKEYRLLAIKPIFALIGGFLLFLIWPIILWLTPKQYNNFLHSSNNVWDMVFGFNLVGKLEGLNIYKYLQNILNFNYLGYGNFLSKHVLPPLFLIFLIAGILLLVISIGQSIRKKKLLDYDILFLLLWLLSFLPIHMHRNHFMAFLLAVSPVFCWIIAKSIDGLSRLRLSKKVVVIITIVVLLAMTTVSTYNVHSGKEILYRTYYKEMGAYVKPKIVDYEYSAFCRYMPGFTYYAGKLCIRPDFIRPHPVDQKTSDWGGLPEQKDLKEYYKDEDIRFFEFDERSIDYFLNKEQKAWVYQNCILIDQKASIPSISHHHLYDCHSDLNGGK